MEHSHARVALPSGTLTVRLERNRRRSCCRLESHPRRERRDCGIFAQDYGQAGAIDSLAAPRTAARAQWPPDLFSLGPARLLRNCMIVLDDRREVLERLWEHVEYVGTSADNPYALENKLTSSLQGREIRNLTCSGQN